MKHDTNLAIQEAAIQTEALLKTIDKEKSDLMPAYKALEEAIMKFEQTSGESAEVLLLAEDEAGLRFRRTGHGRDFWMAYKKRLQKHLCDPRGKLRKLFRRGSEITASIIIAAIVDELELPIMLIPLFGPIVAIILYTSIDAFCDSSDYKPQ